MIAFFVNSPVPDDAVCTGSGDGLGSLAAFTEELGHGVGARLEVINGGFTLADYGGVNNFLSFVVLDLEVEGILIEFFGGRSFAAVEVNVLLNGQAAEFFAVGVGDSGYCDLGLFAFGDYFNGYSVRLGLIEAPYLCAFGDGQYVAGKFFNDVGADRKVGKSTLEIVGAVECDILGGFAVGIGYLELECLAFEAELVGACGECNFLCKLEVAVLLVVGVCDIRSCFFAFFDRYGDIVGSGEFPTGYLDAGGVLNNGVCVGNKSGEGVASLGIGYREGSDYFAVRVALVDGEGVDLLEVLFGSCFGLFAVVGKDEVLLNGELAALICIGVGDGSGCERDVLALTVTVTEWSPSLRVHSPLTPSASVYSTVFTLSVISVTVYSPGIRPLISKALAPLTVVCISKPSGPVILKVNSV